ncbi:MAG TPA: glucose-1-phosphate cytidylyltransferase [Thermoanaerobaculia bacterium]|nr:glucose-1-phosphate cytidylyltransferase [Thermoanaerobaculia bacterium]
MSDSAIPKRDLPVVILCGGQGARLREHTENVPKPMVEIGEQPILWHILKLYGAHGFGRFVLCLGYKGWVIKQYFLRYHELRRDFTVAMRGDPPDVRFHNEVGAEDWRVTCAETGAESGTGGRLKLVERFVDTQTFLFTYGDAVGTVDLDALLAFHRSQGRIATVTGVHPTSRYGEMKVDGGRVVEFNEKPTVAEGLVSGGFFVFERQVFDYLGDDPKTFLELEPLQKLARDGQLSVFAHEGFWHPMDTFRDWQHLNELWKSGRAPWKVWRD